MNNRPYGRRVSTTRFSGSYDILYLITLLRISGLGCRWQHCRSPLILMGWNKQLCSLPKIVCIHQSGRI
jgi:hypothetical protein